MPLRINIVCFVPLPARHSLCPDPQHTECSCYGSGVKSAGVLLCMSFCCRLCLRGCSDTYNAIRFIGVWQAKAGLNTVQYRHNSTYRKHIVQEMSRRLLIMCYSVGNERICTFVSLSKNQGRAEYFTV